MASESTYELTFVVKDDLAVRGQTDWSYVIAFGQSVRGWHVAMFIKSRLRAAGIHESQIELKPLAGLNLAAELGSIGMLSEDRRIFICEAPFEVGRSLMKYLDSNNEFILLYVGDQLLDAKRILGNERVASMDQLFPSWMLVQDALDKAAPFCTNSASGKVQRIFITLHFCRGIDLILLRKEMEKRRIDALVFMVEHNVVRIEYAHEKGAPGFAKAFSDCDLSLQEDRLKIRALFPSTRR